MSFCSASRLTTSWSPVLSACWMSAASCSAAAETDVADAAATGASACGAGCARVFVTAALRDDIDVVPLLHHLVAAQLELAVGDALAGLDVVFIAVPRADE